MQSNELKQPSQRTNNEKLVILTWRQRYKLKKWMGSSIGLVPVGFIIIAVGLSMLLPWVDKQISAETLFVFSASSAQSTLSAIAAGMITFTGFVFSILTFAMQFESSSYTTRLIRMIGRQNFTKAALGVFVATFIYALLLLADVDPSNNAGYVPQYSVLFSVFLVIISVLVFLRLITVVTVELRTGKVVDDVEARGRKMIESSYPHPAVSPERAAAVLRPDSSSARDIKNNRAGGVLQALDPEGITKVASEAGAVVELIPAVGDYVPSGAGIFRIYEEEHPVNERLLLEFVALGHERTFQNDLEYPLRILVDIAIKALSPAVNDPTTAVQALDRIADLILMLGCRQLSEGIFKDSTGKVRFIYGTLTWEEYLSLALTEIRLYGADSPQIAKRLKTLLEQLKTSLPAWRIPVIDKQLKLLYKGISPATL